MKLRILSFQMAALLAVAAVAMLMGPFASANLVVNGDFSSGNTGFTSEYTYTSSLLPAGVYYVGTNPQAHNGNFSPCGDHTTGNGLMMIVNGDTVPDVGVWSQTVAVTPGTDYFFSTWIASVHPTSPAVLQFSINGEAIGPVFTPPSQTCQWVQFTANWNSGSNTSAHLSIVNQNTASTGNDFALDDISLSDISPPTLTASLTCQPSAGTVPFATTMTVALTNSNLESFRRFSGKIDVSLPDGGPVYPNWRAGFTNVQPGDSFATSWQTNIPAVGTVIGDIRFLLTAYDVTPSPYNQPPYPPAGDSDTSECIVTAAAP